MSRKFEKVVDSQAAAARARHSSWPDYDKVAKVGDLTFSRLGWRDGGLSISAQLRESRWGISTRSQLGRYAGNVTLVSTVSRPDSIFRIWHFDSQMQMYVESKNLLAGEDDLNAAVAWARSPHIEGASLQRLVALTEEEQGSVDERMHHLNESAAELQHDLAAIRGGGIRPSPFSNERIN